MSMSSIYPEGAMENKITLVKDIEVLHRSIVFELSSTEVPLSPRIWSVEVKNQKGWQFGRSYASLTAASFSSSSFVYICII